MTNGPFEVVVVGNVGIDTNVYLPGRDVDWTVEANFTQNLDYVGQAGGYTSRGFAQLGRRTAFVGAVGDDWGGYLIRQALGGDGVDLSALFLDPAGTSRSVNIMAADGGRKNFYDGKSHMTLTPDLAPMRRVLAGARLAHVHLPNWARRGLPIARALGVTIACDLQDVIDPNDPYRQDFIAAADILFFSAANHADPAPLMAAFLARNPRLMMVAGMGARGAALGGPDGMEVFPPPSLDLPIVDTNGAGDALAVGFLTGYVLEGRDAPSALRRGQIAARWTCAQKASSSGLITRERLDAYDAG
ncbi:MAG: carbohydrate kinase family protein [Anaerolineae bacterium]|nr:carbohydrate kinase family protein [Anaerolineae bacterium]